LRTYFLSLIILLGTVAALVQTAVAGYDRQFNPPGPVRTWQVQQPGDGGEVVTVWGQSFSLQPDELSVLARSARVYIDRLPGVRELLGGIRSPGEFPDSSPGFSDQGADKPNDHGNQ